MKLRTLIAVGSFALGVLPLVTLVTINLAGHINRHDEVSRQALEERAESLSRLTGMALQDLVRGVAGLANLATTDGGADCRPRSSAACREQQAVMAQTIAHRFADDPRVLAARMVSGNDAGMVGESVHCGVDTVLPPVAADHQVRLSSAVCRVSERSGDSDRVAFVLSTCLAAGGSGPDHDRCEMAISLLVDVEKFMAPVGDFLLATGDGALLYRAESGQDGTERDSLTPLVRFPPDLAPVLAGLRVAHGLEQFFQELGANRTVYWQRLSASRKSDDGLWAGVLFDRSSAQQWKRSLIENIAIIVSLMALIVFFIAKYVAGRIDAVRGDIVEGLRRTLQGGEEVAFFWPGPRELAFLGEELTALSVSYVRSRREKESAEQELALSETRFRSLASSAQDAIIMMTPQGEVTFWNRAATRIFGFTEQEVRGRPVHDLIAPRLADTEENLIRLSHVSDGPISNTLELSATRKGGEAVPIELSVSEALIGEQWHPIWIIRDISERHEAEERLRLQQQQLLQADRMVSLGMLVAGVAHEINNPNSIVLLNTPLLQRAWQSIAPICERHYEEQGDFLLAGLKYSEMRREIPKMFDELLEASGRIRAIVQDLKDYARKEPGRYSELVDLNEVVAAAVRLTAARTSRATEHFTFLPGAGLPKIRGHAQRLSQVVVNLIHNSCDALPDSGAAIAVSTFFDAVSSMVRVRVEDEGCGIAPEHLVQVTDPFFTTRRSEGGTGLGLSVSAGIITEHGGELRFESQVGRGTVATASFAAVSEDIGP